MDNMTSEPVILAVETSSRIGSVALAAGSDLLAASTFSASLRHSAEIFPAVADLLKRFGYAPVDISQVYISNGPGSFTGLRIAVAAAKSMHLASSARIVTVNSLDTIAANLTDAVADSLIQDSPETATIPGRLAAVLDAKRGQFYVAVYERTEREELDDAKDDPGYQVLPAAKGRWQKILPDRLMSANELLRQFAAEDHPLGLLGDGLVYHRDAFHAEGVRILDQTHWSPHAAQVHRLGYQKAQAGRFADPLTLTPFYLRAPQVTLRKAGPDA